jgi:hypothetical protein
MRHYLKKIDKRILIGLGVVGAGVFYRFRARRHLPQVRQR